MPRQTKYRLLPRLARKLAYQGQQKASPQIRSNQLRRGLYVREDPENDQKYALVVPHFWAAYIHDGRGPVRPDTAKVLVWFRNPNDDPRLKAGLSPVRASGVRKLTKAQFQEWSAVNRGIIQRYKKRTGRKILTTAELQSLKLPMIVARYSPGTFRPSKVYPFFSNEAGGGMQGFVNEAGRTVSREVSAHVKDVLSREGLWNVKKKLTVRL